MVPILPTIYLGSFLLAGMAAEEALPDIGVITAAGPWGVVAFLLGMVFSGKLRHERETKMAEDMLRDIIPRLDRLTDAVKNLASR